VAREVAQVVAREEVVTVEERGAAVMVVDLVVGLAAARVEVGREEEEQVAKTVAAGRKSLAEPLKSNSLCHSELSPPIGLREEL